MAVLPLGRVWWDWDWRLRLFTRGARSPFFPSPPPGATDTDQALLPPVPGLYIGLFALPWTSNTNTYNSKGQKLPGFADVHASGEVFGPAFVYVYPFKLFGGGIASSFAQPFMNQNASIGYAKTTTTFGAGDAYSDILSWSKYLGLAGATPGRLPLSYGLTLGSSFSLIIPDGGYDAKNLFKLSSHSWVYDPNFALTYNTGSRLSLGDNTQLSARFFYAIPSRDFTTGYTTGNIVDLDTSITEQFGGFRIGVAASYQAQVTDDHPPSPIPLVNGNKFEDAAAGPIVEYNFPSGVFVKAKYVYTFYHRNYIDQQVFVVGTGFKF